MELFSGQKVQMFLEDDLVGIGCVCRSDPHSNCGGVQIGHGNVSILVEKCLKDVVLPFPTMDNNYLQTSLWSNVRWPKNLLKAIVRNVIADSDDEECLNVNGDEDEVHPMIVDAFPITSPEFDRQIRESWKNKKVLLKDVTMMYTINEGFILYVMPDDCVNFQELGDDSVGVAIERENDAVAEILMSQVGSITLVKWPIKQITMADGSPLQRFAPLYDMHTDHTCHVSGDNNGENVTAEASVERTSNKRSYTFINRKRKDRATPACNLYLSMESVQSVSSIDCCVRKCCQLANRDMVMRVRQDFWGQSQESRTNYVYELLSICWERDEKKYRFKIDGVVVCCKAWYEIHGLPKTSFYRYKEKF